VSKGFLVLAQNTDTVDYVKQAYALALSIKATQSTVTNLSIITNDPVPDHYREVFDQVLEVAWSDIAYNPEWKVENRWKLHYQSPYDETIVLDADMLILDDLTHWWDHCSNKELVFCSTIRNFKNEIIEKDIFHRKAFINNELSNPYVAVHYFKKDSILAYEFYKVLEFVFKNWELCYKKFAPKNYQNWLSFDMSAAVAIEMMGIENQVIDIGSPIEFVHMKPAIQGIWPPPACWQESIHHYFNNHNELLIGNYRQHYALHYVEKDFVTDDLITKLEKRAHGRI